MHLTTRSKPRPAASSPRPVPTETTDQHVVEFYETEQFLVGTVAGFVGPALRCGDGAIVVATAAHRLGIDDALRASRVDVAGTVADGRYLVLDAGETLGAFLVDGAPHRARLATLVEGAVGRAGAGGRRVRIYSEMVAVLWDGGHVAAAIALEGLWNELAAEHGFTLLCAYPMRAFDTAARTADFRRICDEHSRVIPSEQFAVLGGLESQQRAVAELQQEAAALRADLARLQAAQIAAELAYVEGLCARLPAPPDGWQDPDGHAAAAAAVMLAAQQPPIAAAPPAPPTSPAGPALCSSPGGRLLEESLRSLSGRLRYAR